MTAAYFDCFAGAGGDMIVASLLDAGCDFAALGAALAKLGVEGYELQAERANRGGLIGTRFIVQLDGRDHAHRHLGDIVAIIDSAGLAPRAAGRAKSIFTRLADAEAKVHGIEVEKVHFHEVGAIDSIVDVVGACVAMEILGIDSVLCSPIAVGGGTVECDHGTMPVPAPATAQLLVGAKTCGDNLPGEATTPTAAAVLTTLADSFGAMPAMSISAVGCGAGTRDGGPVPNLLRVFLGELDDSGAADTVIELSANIDDCTGEVLGATIAKLLSAGALDAWASPIVMKKSRPAWMLSALCAPGDADGAERIIFAETTTFGIRRSARRRTKLIRRHETVETAYGPIRIKIGARAGRTITSSPEFADCLAAAEAHHVPVRQVVAAADHAHRKENAR